MAVVVHYSMSRNALL